MEKVSKFMMEKLNIGNIEYQMTLMNSMYLQQIPLLLFIIGLFKTDGMIISELLVTLLVSICLGIGIISETMFLRTNSLNIIRTTLVPA